MQISRTRDHSGWELPASSMCHYQALVSSVLWFQALVQAVSEQGSLRLFAQCEREALKAKGHVLLPAAQGALDMEALHRPCREVSSKRCGNEAHPAHHKPLGHHQGCCVCSCNRMRTKAEENLPWLRHYLLVRAGAGTSHLC